MKAIQKKAGRPAVVIDSRLSLKDMQAAVGGCIEMVPVGPGVRAVVNEDGMTAGEGGGPLPANACGLLGDFLVVAIGEDGSPRGLTGEEERKAMAWLARGEGVPHPSAAGEPAVWLRFGQEALDELERERTAMLEEWDAL